MNAIDYTLKGEDFYNQLAWREFAENLKIKMLNNQKTRLTLLQSEIDMVTEGLLKCRPKLTVENYLQNAEIFNKTRPIEERLSRILAGLLEEELKLKAAILRYER